MFEIDKKIRVGFEFYFKLRLRAPLDRKRERLCAAEGGIQAERSSRGKMIEAHSETGISSPRAMGEAGKERR